MNNQKSFFLFGTILQLIVTNLSANGQPVPWSVELTPVTFPGITDFGMRVYGNLAAFYGAEPLKFCTYQDGLVSNCITAMIADSETSSLMIGGEFYEDDTGVYFIGLALTKKSINTYQLSMDEDIAPQILKNSSSAVRDSVFTMSIDYSHRWMAVGSYTYLYMYDIINPMIPRLTSRSAKISSFPILSRGTSLYKNRVCTINYEADTRGLLCFTVRRGQFGASKLLNPNYYFSFVKVYDDVIIGGTSASDASVQIYNASTLDLMAATFTGVGVRDFFRSSDVLVVGNSWDNTLLFINVSDPRKPKLLQSSPLLSTLLFVVSFSADPQYFYSGKAGGPQNSTFFQTKINFPDGMNWSTFYGNSEWNGYGRTQSTLAIRGTLEYTWIYGVTKWIQLNEHAVDTYLPDDADMRLSVSVLAANFVLEVFDGLTWFAVSKGQIITRPSFSSFFGFKSLRVRDLNPNQPLIQPLNQTIQLTADNGRGSQLTYNIWIVRIYQPGPSCPINSECNNSTEFRCNPGHVFDGTQCSNVRKQRSAWIDSPIMGLWILGCAMVMLFLIAFIVGFFESSLMRLLFSRTTHIQTLMTDSLASVNTGRTGITRNTETTVTTDTAVIYSETDDTLTCNS